jgi:hypothetical protein
VFQMRPRLPKGLAERLPGEHCEPRRRSLVRSGDTALSTRSIHPSFRTQILTSSASREDLAQMMPQVSDVVAHQEVQCRIRTGWQRSESDFVEIVAAARAKRLR